jgi:hypothetical protein
MGAGRSARAHVQHPATHTERRKCDFNIVYLACGEFADLPASAACHPSAKFILLHGTILHESNRKPWSLLLAGAHRADEKADRHRR